MQRSNIMRVILDDFTNQEFDFLAEMIYEKITDMGYANDGTFAFTLSVEFEENDDESWGLFQSTQGNIVIISTNKTVAIAYAEKIKKGNRWIIT